VPPSLCCTSREFLAPASMVVAALSAVVDMLGDPTFWNSFLQIAAAAANANANVTILVVLGVGATFKGVFDQKGISDMGKLVYHISLPSLLLANILREVTFDHLRKLWILPFFCTLHISGAWLVASLMCKLLKLSDVEARPALATVMFGNVGALAIAVVKALCQEKPFSGPRFGGPVHCAATATSYIAFYLITQNIWMFTWGERILIKKAIKAKEEIYTPASDNGIGKKQMLLSGKDQPPPMSPPDRKIIVAVPSLSSMMGTAGDAEKMEPSLGINRSPEMKRRTSRNDDDFGLNTGSSLKKSLHKTLSDHELVTLEMRLTRQAIVEAGSRMAMEVKPWSADNHGGADAIMHALEDDVDEEGDSSPGYFFGRRGSRGIIRQYSQVVGDGICAHLKLMLNRCILVANQIYRSVRRWSFRRCYRGTRRRLINLCRALRAMSKNPPLQAATIALIIGLCPPLKNLFVSTHSYEAPLRSVFSAIATLGSAQVPVSMLMLSGSGTLRYLKREQKLVAKEVTELEGAAPPAFSFSKRAVFVMIFGRLICIPLVGFFAWYLLKDFYWMPRDPLLALIVLLESAVPSAQNVVMLLLVHGELAQGSAMAEVILWQYAFAIPSFTIITAVFGFLIVY